MTTADFITPSMNQRQDAVLFFILPKLSSRYSSKTTPASRKTYVQWVPDEEDGRVVAHAVPVTLLSVELDRIASGVTGGISTSSLSTLGGGGGKIHTIAIKDAR